MPASCDVAIHADPHRRDGAALCQAAFEGLKAFRRKDGKASLFRPEENAKRMQTTARRTCMAEVPTDLFVDACKRVVKANLEYLPPYGTGGSMYVRPLLFGSGAQIGVAPADEYTFLVLVTPVGAYYRGGLQAVKAVVFDEYDRAAPQGTGHIKIGGNYVAGLYPHQLAKKMGYPWSSISTPRSTSGSTSSRRATSWPSPRTAPM
jgi:branched-chain amino acid aminotransferase